MSFRFRNLNSLKRVSVTLPTDDEGFTGRRCPQVECEGYFKIKLGTGLTGENLPCVCPYCGHCGATNTFSTKEQIAYAKSVAFRQFTQALRADLKSMEFETKAIGILGFRMGMKLKPGTLPALRHYREKALETKITCDSCTLDYSVFGVFAHCPDCGVHNSLLILRRNLDLIERQLVLAESLEDADLRNHLIENALEDCISAFDGFARESCRVRSSKSSNAKRCTNLSFQNLTAAAKSVNDLFGIDLTTLIGPTDWEKAHLQFMRRHLLAHKAGVIDQKFVDEVGPGHGIPGRRVTIRATDVRELVPIVYGIGTSLIGSLPKP